MPSGSGFKCAESLDLCKTCMLGLSICFFLATRSAKARRWQSPEGVSETDAEGSRENKEAQRFTKTMMTHWFSHSVFCAFLCLLVAETQWFDSFPEHKRQLANISGFRLRRSATLAMQENPAELETAYRPLLTLIEKLNKEPLVSFGDVFFQDKTLPL